jgi:hypothetical protein
MRMAERLMKTTFFPAAGGVLEDRVMNAVKRDQGVWLSMSTIDTIDNNEALSMRGWIFTGIFVLLSLSTVLFGGDFGKVAAAFGSSFLLPLGLTIGGIVSIYGALFIASHLDELEKILDLREK